MKNIIQIVAVSFIPIYHFVLWIFTFNENIDQGYDVVVEKYDDLMLLPFFRIGMVNVINIILCIGVITIILKGKTSIFEQYKIPSSIWILTMSFIGLFNLWGLL